MRVDFVTELQKLKDTSVGLLFLYPLLGIDKKVEPLGVYLGFQEIEIEDSLVCLFHKNQSNCKKWIDELKKHNAYIADYCEDDYCYVVFELLNHHELYEQILLGEYSYIRLDYKLLITQDHNILAKIALFPEEYYQEIAYAFDVDPEMLIDQQFIPAPTKEKDYIFISKSLKTKIQTEFGLTIPV